MKSIAKIMSIIQVLLSNKYQKMSALRQHGKLRISVVVKWHWGLHSSSSRLRKRERASLLLQAFLQAIQHIHSIRPSDSLKTFHPCLLKAATDTVFA